MLDAKEVELLIRNHEIIIKLYDAIVLINPTAKEINGYLQSNFVISGPNPHKCFNMWGKEKRCENCIASRALHEQRTTVKIEYLDDKIYMVTAVPLINDGQNQVVELIKDISKDSLLEVDGTAYGNLHRIINRNNASIVKDAFTRVYNTNYIYERLPEDLYYAHEFSLKLGLIFVNITNLKSINDLYGYSAGNAVIKGYSKLVKEQVRKERDWSARFGGSEFILILNDISEKQAYNICKRLNDKILKIGLSLEGLPLKATHNISYFIVENETMTIDQLIQTARNKHLLFDQSYKAQSNITLEKYLLTERESKTAELLLKGYSNDEIASAHFVSLSTVKKHIASIYAKTNVNSRAEFIAQFKAT